MIGKIDYLGEDGSVKKIIYVSAATFRGVSTLKQYHFSCERGAAVGEGDEGIFDRHSWQF